MTVDPPDIISDHSINSWPMPFDHQPQIVQDREVRQWNKMNREAFRAAQIDSELCSGDHRPDFAGEYFETTITAFYRTLPISLLP